MEAAFIVSIFFIYLIIKAFLMKLTDPLFFDRFRYKKGIKQVNDGKYHQAIEYFSGILRKKPKNVTAHAYRGHAYLKTDYYYEALADFTQALKQDKYIAFVYIDKGMAFFKLQMYEEAFQAFSEAIEFFPDSARLYKLRGLAARNLRWTDQSRKDFQKAVQLGDETCNYSFDYNIIDEL